MAIIDMVAKELNMKHKELLNESLKTYLEKRLSKIEADIFLLAKKYQTYPCEGHEKEKAVCSDVKTKFETNGKK